VTSIKIIARIVIFAGLVLLFASGVWAENNNPASPPPPLQYQQNPKQPLPVIEETLITDQEQPVRAETAPAAVAPKKMPVTSGAFKKIDFENSVCFKCHQVSDFNPSEKTEQQWRMLIEKNGHDIFKKIVWESPGQKEQILTYLIKHAGGSGAEGIGVWH
jgi:hypothetical protein